MENITKEVYYNEVDGLIIRDDPVYLIGLSKSDELLGNKIIDIQYRVDDEGESEIIFELSNGSTIEIYKNAEGKIKIESD